MEYKPRGRCFIIGFIIITILINVGIYSYTSWEHLSEASPAITNRDITFVNWENGTQFEKMKRFPECIIIGAKKAGTDAIVSFLKLHPSIKPFGETHFFSLDSNYRRGLEFYRKSLPFTYPYQKTIEKTPRYLVSERAAKRIQQFKKNMKLIVTLRHPIKRMISDYWHVRRHRYKNNRTRYNETVPDASLTFEDLAIDKETGKVNMDYQPFNNSMYYMHLTHWLEYFPREQIHIVDGDNLIVNPIEEIEKMETFLGLEHRVTKDKVYFDSSKGFYCMIRSGRHACMSEGKGHIHPDVDPLVIRKLLDFFKPLNEQLFSLLGRRFNWD